MKLLELALIASIVGFAFNKMMEPDMIFASYKGWLNYLKYLGKKHKILAYISHPLGLCIVCSTTWIGFIIALSFLEFNIIHILIVGMCSATFVIFIENIFKIIQNNLK